MLYVKRLVLIDSAEEKSQWLKRVGRSWGADLPIAVRARRHNSTVLGSTIPKELSYNAAQDSWCVSWVEVDAPKVANKNAAPATEAARSDPAGKASISEKLLASMSQGGAVNGDGRNGDPTPASGQDQEATGDDGHQSMGKEAQLAESEGIHPHSTIADEGERVSAGDEGVPETSASHEQAAVALANFPPATSSADATAAVHQESEELIGIDVSGSVADGFVVLEVITLAGNVKCTTMISVSSALHEAPVQHFTVILTPLETAAVDDRAIHGVLEFTMVEREWLSRQSAPIMGLVCCSPEQKIPTPVETPAVLLSTTNLYFPSAFLTATGAFIVSNVVCVQSRSDREVSVEIVTTRESRLLKVVPPTATLHTKGERAFIICTWSLFDSFKVKADEESDAGIKVHALLRENGVNLPPIDFTVHAEFPQQTQENSSFLFWVNSTMVSNAPCSAEEMTTLKALLPVYSIQKKITSSPSDSAKLGS